MFFFLQAEDGIGDCLLSRGLGEVDKRQVQDLIVSGAVSRFGFVRGVGVSSMPDPRVNLTGEPYLTDGLRLVLFLNEPRRSFDQIDFLDWERVSP